MSPGGCRVVVALAAAVAGLTCACAGADGEDRWELPGWTLEVEERASSPDIGDDGAEEVDPPCDPTHQLLVDQGFIEVGEPLPRQTLPPCTIHRYWLAAPAGSRIEVELTPWTMYPLVMAVDYPQAICPLDEALVTRRAEVRGDAVVAAFEPPRSGELALLVQGTVPAVASPYDLALRCVDGCDLETTRFPIVLVHGWTGWKSIGPIDYFYGVPGVLADRGYPVFVAELDPYNSVEVRSEQLAEQIDWLLEHFRARKVDIIAHSQGGLDSRRMISTLGYGDRVASLVTVATPHRGTPITDIALGLLPGDSEAALYWLLELVGAAAAGADSDAEASFYSLSQDYVQGEFNPSNPDDPRVDYVSWTGRTCLYGVTCGDVCDFEIRWAYGLIYLAEGPNDGMVPVSSAPWGDYRGEVPADHFDEIGQLFGVTGPNFGHVDFYLGLARDLEADGH